MPDHIYMLIRKHKHQAEEMFRHLQIASCELLHERGFREHGHPVWGGPGWKVFLDNREDIECTIRYVEDNPVKMRAPKQHWTFVSPYNGWLPGMITKAPPRFPK